MNLICWRTWCNGISSIHESSQVRTDHEELWHILLARNLSPSLSLSHTEKSWKFSGENRSWHILLALNLSLSLSRARARNWWPIMMVNDAYREVWWLFLHSTSWFRLQPVCEEGDSRLPCGFKREYSFDIYYCLYLVLWTMILFSYSLYLLILFLVFFL